MICRRLHEGFEACGVLRGGTERNKPWVREAGQISPMFFFVSISFVPIIFWGERTGKRRGFGNNCEPGKRVVAEKKRRNGGRESEDETGRRLKQERAFETGRRLK